MSAKIIYLNHSGFVVELEQAVFIFDLFTDPAKVVADYEMSGRPVVFLVSHNHYDHWNQDILDFDNSVITTYILDEGCRKDIDAARLTDSRRRYHFVHPGSKLTGETVAVPGFRDLRCFGSTDAGVSFLLQTEAGSFFHAGDLNDWDWQDEASQQVRSAYQLQLDAIHRYLLASAQPEALPVKVAFVPLDARLEEKASCGCVMFVKEIPTAYLIPMHLNGGEHLPQLLADTLKKLPLQPAPQVLCMTVPGEPFQLN
ncbi:MBL fold metallo-hydrolase [Oscillospiraceae bacterium HV4-5-C5C]|nr:MBL fold metallo-hydrolase [Oscillospiraceae bacterium HV4-5-C5C]